MCCTYNRIIWGCVHILRMLISLLTFSAISMCLIFPLLRIFTATFWPVIIWWATTFEIKKKEQEQREEHEQVLYQIMRVLDFQCDSDGRYLLNKVISNSQFELIRTFNFSESTDAKRLSQTILSENNRNIIHLSVSPVDISQSHRVVSPVYFLSDMM